MTREPTEDAPWEVSEHRHHHPQDGRCPDGVGIADPSLRFPALGGHASLQARVDALTWYHTFDLPSGVSTPGYVDYRPIVERLPFPEPLAGKRCLDVGTRDGFWAFEMERRGGRPVVGIDLDDVRRADWPARTRLVDPASLLADSDTSLGRENFELVRDLLGSTAERIDLSVYEVSPERVGHFDLVFIGDILLHLRDPVAALERVRSVCRGEVLVLEAVDLVASITRYRRPGATLEGTRVRWWTPNAAGLWRMAQAAGFDVLDHSRTGTLYVPLGEGHSRRRLREVLKKGPVGVITSLRGAPHMALRLRPVG